MKRLTLPSLALLPLLLAAAPIAPPPSYLACLAQARQTPETAIASATAWRLAGGGVPARHCLGLAYLGAGKFAQAALAFEQAAMVAATENSKLTGDLWGQAGNAQLLAGDAQAALTDLDAALKASVAAPGVRLGELRIDRARALVELGKLADARADLDTAVKLAPSDPVGWLLRATLARREGRYADAEVSLATALKLAPTDPAALLEAGNLAGMQGDIDSARTRWQAAVATAPKSEAGQAAAKALAANPG